MNIRIASVDSYPVAAIMTLRHKGVATYKYGCSDARFNRFGGMQMLLWMAIQDAKADGAVEFDLGRTDEDNLGLIAFKDRWGAVKSTLKYYRLLRSEESRTTDAYIKRVSTHLPDWILAQAGMRFYKHFA